MVNVNLDKLPEYIPDFENKKILIAGLGAVGSWYEDLIVKMGCKYITNMDKDNFEAENSAKGSWAYDVKEDVGKNKAIAIADRMNDWIGEKCVHGIDGGVESLGPMAFAAYDVVILAVDNYHAKIEGFNQKWLQIPPDQRPLLIYGGTFGEDAQCNILDGNEACVRCLVDEKWLENPLKRTSCTGINYRNAVLSGDIVRTTGLASRICADLMAEHTRAYFCGNRDMVNKRIFYNAYPNFGMTKAIPMKRKSCPDCKNFHYYEDMLVLPEGDVLHTTVNELIKMLTEKIGVKDFYIDIPIIEYAKVVYGNLIKDDYCKCCGREMKNLYRHEFKTTYEAMLCDECKNSGNKANDSANNGKVGTFINIISSDNCDEILGNKTLYDIGFRLGEIIVAHRMICGSDILDGEYVDYVFYFAKDQEQLLMISKLEE